MDRHIEQMTKQLERMSKQDATEERTARAMKEKKGKDGCKTQCVKQAGLFETLLKVDRV